MPRFGRMVIPGQQAVYHVMSRSCLDGYPFNSAEKDMFVKIIQKFSRIYFTEVLGFCVMGNHFHLLVRMFPGNGFADREVKKRYALAYGNDRVFPGDDEDRMIRHYREKWSSLSKFVQEIKQTFSRYYNKRHGRRGTLWGERFKSVIVENGNTLINCLAYIDLNPVRAGIVEKPEDYRWNAIGYHVQTENKNAFLSLDFGLTEFNVLGSKERFRRYRRFLYEKGTREHQMDENTIRKERKKDFQVKRINRFRHRTRYFTDSGIIGTKDFVFVTYLKFKHFFQTQHDKIPKRIAGLDGIYSMKRLSESCN